jgi:HEAT repeats/PBS lyase HEAT-like repeat
VSDQRDLPGEVAGVEGSHVFSPHRHLGRPVEEHEERAARLALPDELAARRKLLLIRDSGDIGQLPRRATGEKRHALEDLGVAWPENHRARFSKPRSVSVKRLRRYSLGSDSARISAVLEFFSPKVTRLRRKRDVASLIAALSDRSARVRRAAANALVEIPDPRTPDPLIAALGDSDPAVRANAALALGEFEDARPETPLAAIVQPLVAALEDESPSVRAMAASALARMKDPRAVEPLVRLLDDESELVRQTATSVLRGFGDPRADEALKAAQKS